jgi:hypothetical protein
MLNSGMKIERTGAGLEARLAMAGISRFFSAAFLAVWLAGWAVGEAFAVWLLSVGAWSLLTGHPPEAGREPLRPEVALPIGLFLLFWLALWTLGGVMAGRELLRLLFGRDCVRVGNDALEIEHSYGLFCSRERLPQVELRRFYRRPGSAALCVETARGTTELTRLGTACERAELEEILNAEFRLATQPAPEAALPEAWCETFSLERDAVLVKNPATRRKQAITAWIFCALLGALTLYVISGTQRRAELWVPAIVLAGFSAAAMLGAVWLSFGRDEWKLEKGRLVLQRRFGANRTTKFEAVALELFEDNSGDGGPSYELTAIEANAPPRPSSYRTGKHRRVIYSKTDDPTEPRKFGQWLSERWQLPFADQTTHEAKAQSLEELKQQLVGSGPLGRFALRVIERLGPSDRPPEAPPR